MFQRVDMLDAVGTLVQEATVSAIDAKLGGDHAKAEIYCAVADAIKAAWPDLVSASLSNSK